MHMELLLGILIGMPIGVLMWWMKNHKPVIMEDIDIIKSDMISIQTKLDKILSK